MNQQAITRRFVMTSLMAAVLSISPWAHAVSILSGPFFTPAPDAPLAGTLSLTTDVKSRVSVLVSDGTNVWEKDFYDFSTNHSEILLGFKPDRTNLIQVTVYDKDRNAYTAPELLPFVTAPLPADFPAYKVLKSEPSMMEPGYMMFIMEEIGYNTNYIVLMDNSGEVVWYRRWTTVDLNVQQLDNGDLFIYQQSPSNNFLEMNMLGDPVRIWDAPTNYPVNIHEGFVTDHGTIMYLSDASRWVTNLPTSASPNPTLTTTQVDDNPVVEISYTNAALLNVWSPLDMIDPTRVTYLTYASGVGQTSPYGVDTEHANAIIDDTNDNSVMVSLRAQNAIIDFSRATGKLKWILGPHALWGTNWQQYLLTPVGTPFDWNYGQHAPGLTPQGTLLVYNDNNFAASPYDPPVANESNYSSAIEYDINETNMTVSEVWNSAWQTNQDRLYTPYLGRVQWLPQTRNVLVDYGAATYVNGSPATSSARIIEYTHDPIPRIVFDVSFSDYNNSPHDQSGDFCYRAYQIPDLYPHPTDPVTDLTVNDENQIPLLEFSADPTHGYLIQASTDLTHWTTIATFPACPTCIGDYDFQDLNAGQFTIRFYRVVTVTQ